ncbi:MAG TPA: heavy-metal-associated domain-containing protein [Catenuloplanes sp.]|jgi:Cu+-exporting ATPase
MQESSAYSFTVSGMHCASCGMLIDETLEELPGVHRSQTSVRAGRTIVDVDPVIANEDTLIAAIAAAGYTARRDPP